MVFAMHAVLRGNLDGNAEIGAGQACGIDGKGVHAEQEERLNAFNGTNCDDV